jgi:uncharacterized protein
MPLSSEIPPPLVAIIKTVSEFCNLRCRYCYYRGLDQGNSQKIMPTEVLHKLTSQILQWDRPKASFVWHGGEPLLAGIEFYQAAVAQQSQVNARLKLNRQIVNSIQTNGILVNEEWAELFSRYRFIVGVSVDGPEHIHNRQRIDLGGRGTYRGVMRGVDLLRRRGLRPSAVCVVHKDNVDEPEAVFKGLHDSGFETFHFKAMYDFSHGVMSADSVSGDEYAEFLLQVFRLWATADNPVIDVGNFTSILAGLLGGRPGLCEHAGQCGSFITVDWDGRIGPCDAFARGKFDFGDIVLSGIAQYRDSMGFRKFQDGMSQSQTKCHGCEFFRVCAGGCFKYSYNPITELWGHSAYCSSKKVLFRELTEYARTGKIQCGSNG